MNVTVDSESKPAAYTPFGGGVNRVAAASAFLFCMHSYFLDCTVMSVGRRHGLLSMPEASREYKGLAESSDAIVKWVATG